MSQSRRAGRQWALGAVLVVLAGGGVIRAEPLDDPGHIDELAAYVQQTSNALCWEMHRYHRHQPSFSDAYRAGKEVWGLAGALRDELREAPLDEGLLADRAARINELFAKVDETVATWGDGVRPPSAPGPVEPRAVVVTPGPGVDLDIPFFGGVRVGAPRVRMIDPGPAFTPRQPHRNAHGSRRALERALSGARTAVGYLLEDSGAAPADAPSPGLTDPEPVAPAVEKKPAADSKESGPSLSPPVKISPAKKNERP